MQTRTALLALVPLAMPCFVVAQTAGQTAPHARQLAVAPSGDSAAVHRPRPTPLPAWLRFDGELRIRPETYDGGGFDATKRDQYALTRVLLGARVRPGRLASLYVQGMDARAPYKLPNPAGAPFRDDIDLRQAYLQLGANDSAWVRAGRLELAFGDGRLVGALPWANTARTFDGILSSVVRPGYRVDLFAASVVKVVQDRFDRSTPGNNFYGAYGVLPTLVPNGTVEPFAFWRRQSGLRTELGAPGVMNFGTLGLHAFGKLPSHFDYDLQMAGQRGGLADESISAWAGHWLLGYTLAGVTLTPRISGEYNAASGDANPTDNRKGTFDQLYPTGHDKYGLTDLVGWQNMKHVRTALDLALPRKWTASARFSRYWLADARDALYNGGGAALARDPTGAAGTDVGREVDVVAWGKLRRDLGLSAGVGRLLPGHFLRVTTPGASYTYTYTMLSWTF